MSDKIYCKDCKNFRAGEKTPFSYGPPDYNRLTELCMAPENFKDSHKESDELPISIPSIINKWNDCIWYDPIEDDSSSSSSSSGICIIDMP